MVALTHATVLPGAARRTCNSSMCWYVCGLPLQVVDMRDYSDYAMKQKEFFKAFSSGGDSLQGSRQPLMLKVKDYPPEAAFAEEMPRHWQVNFCLLLCMCVTIQSGLHAAALLVLL